MNRGRIGPAQWSALVPMALSLAALATFVAFLAIGRPAREPDEGTGAHLWQLLMAAQLPIAGVFALTWLPRAPRSGWVLLAVQAVAIFTNLALVRSLNL